MFFSFRKTTFKCWLDTPSIPPRYLAVYQASSAFSNHNPDSFSIPGGSIEIGFTSSIASRHLVDRSSFYSWFCWNCSSTPPWYLSCRRSFSRHLPRQVSRYLLTPASVKIYCRHYISSLCDLVLISIDLSLDTSLFSLPKHSHLIPNFVLQGFFKLFQEFLPLVSFQSSHIHAFHVLKPRFWGFSKLMSYYWNFGMSFHLNEFKTSYIASH